VGVISVLASREIWLRFFLGPDDVYFEHTLAGGKK